VCFVFFWVFSVGDVCFAVSDCVVNCLERFVTILTSCVSCEMFHHVHSLESLVVSVQFTGNHTEVKSLIVYVRTNGVQWHWQTWVIRATDIRMYVWQCDWPCVMSESNCVIVCHVCECLCDRMSCLWVVVWLCHVCEWLCDCVSRLWVVVWSYVMSVSCCVIVCHVCEWLCFMSVSGCVIVCYACEWLCDCVTSVSGCVIVCHVCESLCDCVSRLWVVMSCLWVVVWLCVTSVSDYLNVCHICEWLCLV